jgi:hypothetical protein
VYRKVRTMAYCPIIRSRSTKQGQQLDSALRCALAIMRTCSKSSIVLAGLAPIFDAAGDRQRALHLAQNQQTCRKTATLAAFS